MKRFLPWLVVVFVAVAGVVVYVLPGAHAPMAAVPSVQVDMISLSPGSLPSQVSGYGSIIAGPEAEKTVTLPGAGIVTSIPVLAGQMVSAGEPIAVIAPDAQSIADYHRAETALVAARANRMHV
ncbi:MAG: efflux RND transporter periplasmic adaptor subunit, partial [Acidocella sp.]|nr:efflux RND transporter periplasmic adaptor subunit [Acidocella sp.]